MTHAEFEMDLLEKTVKDAIATPFKKEILELVNKVLKSGQSGGSMPITARVVAKTVESLCLQNNIAPITGEDWEWVGVSNDGDDIRYQNRRMSSIFKTKKNGIIYLDAIVFQEHGTDHAFTSSNSVEMPDGSIVQSRQIIKSFPFEPKTFYIDVTSFRFDKDKATGKLTPNPEGDWWEHKIKDVSQLEAVKEYYDFKTFQK